MGTLSQKPGDLFDGSIASIGVRFSGRTLLTGLLGRISYSILSFFLLLFLLACGRSKPEPVTIMFLDPEWSQPEVAGNHGGQKTSVPSRARLTGATERFVRETGIRVEHSPLPETSFAQLDLVQKLFREHSASPDLLGIDVVWPEIIDDYLWDLKPYFSSELSSLDPELIASFTVKGNRIVVSQFSQPKAFQDEADFRRPDDADGHPEIECE